YFLVGLYALRIVLSFFGIMKFENPTKKGTYKLKEKFQFWVYLVFYICLAVSLITGLFIELSDNAYKKIVEEIHKLSIYYLIAFIVIHLAGVLIAEFTNQQGIISKMISGKKKAIKE